jgi:hypothetical protein
VPTRPLLAASETSFLAYLHYLEDIAGVIGGRYGDGVAGVYQTMQLHPPVLALAQVAPEPAALAALQLELAGAWDALAIVDNAVAPAVYDPQANAVVPSAGVRAVVAAARALAVALGTDRPDNDAEALGLLGDLAEEELLPYPWSAFCSGCPQTGSYHWGDSVLPGETVSVFQRPSAETSDARLAMLLRTTRQRALEEQFAVHRQTDVRPGRTRRNLSADHKEDIARSTPPTTVFDVLERVRRRADADDGAAFVEGAFDDEEARSFAVALAAVADGSVAVVEAVIAAVVGWDVFTDLVSSYVRRHPAGASAARRRLL